MTRENIALTCVYIKRVILSDNKNSRTLKCFRPANYRLFSLSLSIGRGRALSGHSLVLKRISLNFFRRAASHYWPGEVVLSPQSNNGTLEDFNAEIE